MRDCSLSDHEKTRRSSELAEGLMGRVREVRELPDGYALRFDSTPESRDEVEAFSEFERRCCASLGFEVRAQGDELWLSITGSPTARNEIGELLRGVGVEQARRPGRRALPAVTRQD